MVKRKHKYDMPLALKLFPIGVVPAEQGNAVDAFGPEPVRISLAPAGLGATDCGRWPAQ